MDTLVYGTLRVLIVLAFAGSLLVQFVLLFPGTAQSIAQERDVTAVPLAVSTAGVAFALCLEAALAATWQLLKRAQRKALFATGTLRWVDVMIVSGAAAALLVLACSVPLARLAMSDDAPGLIALCAVALVAAFAVVLLLLVVRGVLRDAAALHAS